MYLKESLAAAATAAALGFGAVTGAGVASADPDSWEPWDDRWKPGHFDKEWKDWDDRDRDWKRYDRDRDWYKWYDHQPPWGWGPPPRAEWRGALPPPWGPPPPSFDYWGHRVHPVWDPGFHAWGFWLFGLFIPLVAVG